MQKISLEACLEMMVGLSDKPVNPPFIILDKDRKILTDIAKKVYRGTALTDRQYATVKRVLRTNYSTQFKNRDIDIHASSNILRKPLRQIDRSSYIKIGNYKEFVYDPFSYYAYQPNHKVLVIRFPFNVTYSKLMGEVRKCFPFYRTHKQKDKNKYILPYNERLAHKVVDKFKGKITDIDPTLLEIHEKCEYFYNNKQEFLPGIYDFKIKNCLPKTSEHYVNKFGQPSPSNLFLFKDRSEYLGLKYFSGLHLEHSLADQDEFTKRLVKRKASVVVVEKKKWELKQVIKTMFDLKRIPLLVVLPVFPKKDPAESLEASHKIFKNYVDNKDISVLFRLENMESGIKFNEYVRENGLNNKLANNTKIVYINNKKIPKPLLRFNWEPEGVLCLDTTRNYSKVNSFEEEFDLVVQYATEEHSPWNPYFVMENI